MGSLASVPLCGLQPHIWASLCQDYPALLQSLLPWLHQKLQLLLGAENPQADVVEDLMMSSLSTFRLQENVLIRLLGFLLKSITAMFVHQLIDFRHQCIQEDCHLLSLQDFCTATRQEGSPVASPGSAVSLGESPTFALFLTTSSARDPLLTAPHGGLTHPSSVPFPVLEDEVPWKERRLWPVLWPVPTLLYRAEITHTYSKLF